MRLILIAAYDPGIPAKAGIQGRQALAQNALDRCFGGGDDENMESLG